MTPIEADHYREEVANLKVDPIVIKLSDELWEAPQFIKDELWDHNGEPTHRMHLGVNREYRVRGGTQAHTIGGVARAITTLHKERVENNA